MIQLISFRHWTHRLDPGRDMSFRAANMHIAFLVHSASRDYASVFISDRSWLIETEDCHDPIGSHRGAMPFDIVTSADSSHRFASAKLEHSGPTNRCCTMQASWSSP
jgi:hypothetical protein